ncbi:MAG: GIY-YIG nuclease family protein [Candidatus Moranbacteria bacterium]|nr:GIY-YIG nuclease family protein [Candidatus Moranbacteria bacterium]
MYYVYILRSGKDQMFYTGMTGDLKRRMLEHRTGKVESTRSRRPLELLCYEAYTRKEEAERREKFLKSSDGKKDLKKRLKESLEEENG